MKSILLLLVLAAIPLCAYGGQFVYADYDYYEDDYWYDEYWEDDYRYDGYWVYYPHGYYCVRFVWWYPWWWDTFWWRCHWCHHFSWDFFYCGFYIVWYEDGCWWFRPRYGRWVRYRVPYTYREIWHNARGHGINLPDKPPREINVPYRDQEIRKLAKQRDPELFRIVEKEYKSGNLEKMRKTYTTQMNKEITRKNQEYRAKANPKEYDKSVDNYKHNTYTPTKPSDTRDMKRQSTYDAKKKSSESENKGRVIKRDKERTQTDKSSSHYDTGERQNPEVKKGQGSPSKQYEPAEKPSPQEAYKKSPKDQDRKRALDMRDKKQQKLYSTKYKG